MLSCSDFQKTLKKISRLLLDWLPQRHPLKSQTVEWGGMRRLTPVSRIFGLDRGTCIDRYYIEKFLYEHRADIRGCVLEVGDAHYTNKFGAAGTLTRAEVLHAVPGNPQATLIGDLATGRNIPSEAFNCMILTQVYPFIYDMHGACACCHRALKPGGVLLATFPGISQISRYDMERWGDYWRFTDASARKLFGDVFGPEQICIETYGNVLAACSFLHGLSCEDLNASELDYRDPDYQVLITVRAVKKE